MKFLIISDVMSFLDDDVMKIRHFKNEDDFISRCRMKMADLLFER
mgnify:CR=1 FL=1